MASWESPLGRGLGECVISTLGIVFSQVQQPHIGTHPQTLPQPLFYQFLPLPKPHLLSQAPVTFFDCTPTGRVLNRFSSDVACVDDSLPFILNILLANAAGLLGLLAVLGSGLPWLLLLLPLLSVIYYRVQRHYRASSRELRRLGSLTLSPLYTHLADTLAGLPVLRAAGVTHRCVKCASASQSPGQ